MATKAMSGERYVTLSAVIVITNCLQDVYSNLQKQPFSAASKEVVNSIITGLNTQFKNLELLVSTFLDPRFKNVGFSSKSVADTAKEKLSNLLTNLIARNSNTNGNDEVQNIQQSTNSEQTNSIWSSFDKKAAAFSPTGTCKTRAIIELQRYLEEPLLTTSRCSIKLVEDSCLQLSESK